MPSPERVVLDTNAVLDAWWFDDAATRALRNAIETGRLWWLLTDAMAGEVSEVLARSPFCADIHRCKHTLSSIDMLGRRVCAPGAIAGLSCADPDDQIFVDLAVAARPCWLVSRDRAVLSLANRALAWSCRIVTPARWPGPPQRP